MTQGPEQITEAAIGNDVKGVATRLGKHPSWVYRMTETPNANAYGKFLQLYYAVGDEGKEIFFQDFRARHNARARNEHTPQTDTQILLGDLAEKVGGVIKAVYNNPKKADVVKEVAELSMLLEQLVETYEPKEKGRVHELMPAARA